MKADELNARIKGVTQAAPLAIDPYPCVIYCASDGHPEVTGTGTLLRIADEHFLITAAHVVDPVKRDKEPLLMAPRGESKGLIDLGREFFMLTEGPKNRPDHSDDSYDVAAVSLSTDNVKKIRSEFFITLDKTEPNIRTKPGTIYTTMGYPEVDSNPDIYSHVITSKPQSVTTVAYHGQRGPIADFDSKVHLALDFRANNVMDGSGISKVLPGQEGMSGSAIFRVCTIEELKSGWNQDFIRLVGILHRYNRKLGVYIGTRLGYVLQLIVKYRPGFKKIFDFHSNTTWIQT